MGDTMANLSPKRGGRLVTVLMIAGLAGWGQSVGAEPLPVVATFSILGDLVKAVGGTEVMVTVLVGPGNDIHAHEPTPRDAQALAGAGLVVINGLGLEGWIERLVKASGYRGPVVVAARSTAPLAAPGDTDHDHGHGQTSDPHVWQAVANVKTMVGEIRDGLIAAAPERAEAFRANGIAYLTELDHLDDEIRAALAPIPAGQRKVVTSHDAFGHYGHAYGVNFLAAAGMGAEAEPSAKAMAGLIRLIRLEKVGTIFVESIHSPRMQQRIAKETGAVIGEPIYSDALSPPNGPAGSYLAMMRHNTRQFVRAMSAP
ncbi:zinc/manganese transport system substrate-binding protein [uncultured Gammaproteobacteria bacterium]